MLSFFNLPRAGFCKMSEPDTVPRSLIENWQLCPDATLTSPVGFSPQSASSTNIGHSEAASAGDADIEPATAKISAQTTALDNRMVASSFSCRLLTVGRDWGSVLRLDFSV